MSGERPEMETEGKTAMNPRTKVLLIFFGAMTFLAIMTCPYEDIAAFDPIQWLNDSINGVFNVLFGWIP